MKYSAIRTRAIERMAEYRAGAAEGATTASLNGQTIYDRITEVYRDMLFEVQIANPEKLLTTTTLAYTANSESVALPAAVLHRPIIGVERQVNTVQPYRFDPIRVLTLEQMQTAFRFGELPVMDQDAPWSNYGYYIEGEAVIYVVPTPASDLTLRFRYVAGVVDLVDASDDNNTPTLIAEEYHALLALETALRFLRETANPATLEVEKAQRWAAFLKWASASPKTGTRKVREL